MKRLLYISVLFAVALATSCLREPVPVTDLSTAIAEHEGEPITVYFDVETPEATSATKAMSHEPNIRSLHVAVFGSSGYLKEYKTATPVNGTYVSQEGIANKQGFKVDLSITGSRVRVHLIANGPDYLDFEYESTVMAKLTTELPNDAYWQRIILENGIFPDVTDPGYAQIPPVLVIDPSFDLDTDGTTHKMHNIPLIRNFANIKVNAAENSNLVIHSFAVVNVPSSGTIAPYNTLSGDFISDYQHYPTLNALKAVYPGNLPSGTTIDTTYPEDDCFKSGTSKYLTQGVVAAGSEVYMYERPVPKNDATVLIVYGTYTDEDNIDHPSFYKIDLMDKGEYLPILRNFSYQINILEVHRQGKTTVESALNGAGSGDISADISTATQNKLSDGQSSIAVSYTEITHPIGGTYEVTFTFVPDVQHPNQNVNQGVTYELLAPSANGAVIASTSDIVLDTANGKLTYTTTDVDPERIKSQDIRIIGVSGTSRLYRNITIRLLPKQKMTVTCISPIQQAAGAEQDVTVTIPQDLPVSIFPLQFKVEAAAKSLTPRSNDLPVDSDTTIVTGSTGLSYQFIKTVSYEDYLANYATINGKKISSFTCLFKSIFANSDSQIFVYNKYFDKGSTSFVTRLLRKFTVENGVYGFNTKYAFYEDDKVEFKFALDKEHANNEDKLRPSDGYITVTLTGLVPDPDYNSGSTKELYYVSGNTYRYFVPEGITAWNDQVLHLCSTGTTAEYKVELSASDYENNHKINYAADFGNVALSNTNVFYGNGWPTTLSFTIPNDYPIRDGGFDVVLDLENLEPDSNPNITYNSTDGKYYYHVTSAGQKTVNLKTAGNRTGAATVTLTAPGFTPETINATRSYLNIASGTITNSGPNNSMRSYNNTVDIYTNISLTNQVASYTTNTGSYFSSYASATNRTAADFSSNAVDATTMLYFSMYSQYNRTTYWGTSMTASAFYNNGNNVTVTFGSMPTFATGISLNKTTTSIQRGSTETLTATVTPNNATDRTVTWSTSDASVATVSSSGVVSAVGVGTATITATTNDGTNLSASCTVTVYWNAVTGVSITPATATVNVGETTTLSAVFTPANASNQNVTWTSSNTSVATVNASGVVTGVSEGNATITVTTADGGYTATATITVIPVPVTGVSLNASNITLTVLDGVADTQQLTATIAPSNATNKNVTWTSSNTSVATVSNTGLVTAVGRGTTTITVTTADGGYQATCQVKVRLGKTFNTNSSTVSGTGSQTLNNTSPFTVTLNVNSRNNSSYVQLNRNANNIIQVSVSGGYTMTSIVLNLNNNTAGNMTCSTTTYSTSTNTGTWTGSATSVSFNHPTNSGTRVQLKSIVVYYE